MFAVERLVPAIVGQSAVLAASWLLAYLFAARVRRGHWLVSLVWFGALEAGAFVLLRRLGVDIAPREYWAPALVFGLGSVAATDDWNAFGQACMAATLTISALFLVYIVEVTVLAHLGPLSLVFSLMLLALQAAALVLLIAGSYEILDVLSRVRWRHLRRAESATDWFPRVSLHVPAYNEPPEMVIETLDALARLDYPSYEVIVIDDNSTDERLWRPVEAHCAKLGFRFFHLENWPGFKSGALNSALKMTDPAAEIVGVVDSDYVVERDYLRGCVGFFRDPAVAFVQTPQDYREVRPDDRYAQACYDAYLYFFALSMVSRNEHNAIIFAGTMGLIRKQVLDTLGGWDEWCITEDAELSLRILDAGHRGVYLRTSYGRGLMPLNFAGLKKQRFRWAFGGMQILRRHWGALMPWARWLDPEHKLTLAQKWAYLLGGLAWLNDPVSVAFAALLLIGTGSLLFAHSLFIQPLAPAVLIVPFLFVFVGISRFLWALRVQLRCGLRRSAAAFAVLLGLTWVVTLACVLGLTRRQGVFLRTPKARSARGYGQALRVAFHESGLWLLCLAAAVALAWRLPGSPHVWMMSGLLVWQSVVFGSALLVSLWSRRSELAAAEPARSAAWRTTGLSRGVMIGDRRLGRLVMGLGAFAAIFFVFAVRMAPDPERIFRTNPYRVPLVPAAMMATPDKTQIQAVLFLEAEAALAGSVEEAVRLWDPQGTIRDERSTPWDPADDRVWAGLDGIRQRYVEEFKEHRYLALSHDNESVIIEGDRATVIDDLHAQIRARDGMQQVYLSRSDRWTLARGPGGWRITSLTLNRTPR